MTSTQRFTVELAKHLESQYDWHVTDIGDKNAICIENTTELHEAVCACAHHLIAFDRVERIRTLEAELEFLRGISSQPAERVN
jgi:hypothetical protein